MPKCTTLIKFISSILFGFCAASQWIHASDFPKKQVQSNGVTFNKINSLQICQSNEKNCVYEFHVLHDLFPKQNITVINNYGMIGDKSLTHIIYSAKFSDGKDLYAIFITQTNEVDGSQGLSTCNACGAKLGMVIYQYHNKWKLFAAQDNLVEGGGNGKIEIVNNTFSVYSLAAEKIMITYDTYGQAQGYENTSKHIITVNLDLYSSITTSSKSNIKYYGNLTIKESSCNAKSDGEYWNGLVKFENVNFSVPTIKMEKVYFSCLKKKIIRKENVELVKNAAEKKLSPKVN